VYEPDLNLAMQLVFSGLSQKEREFLDLCEVREVLEIKAAELAAARAGTDDIKRLREILLRMETRATRGEKPAEEDVAFHRAVFVASGNVVLNTLIEPISNLLLAARRAGWLAPDQVLQEHRLILEAIAAKDRKLAAESMRSHVRHSTETFLNAFIGARESAGAPSAPSRKGGTRQKE
jgi:GntR family transcriptional repressor for pyruvate dehydrogenase complex